MLSCVVNSRPEPRQTFLLASRDEKLVTASPLQSALTNLDARNSFRTLHLARLLREESALPKTAGCHALFLAPIPILELIPPPIIPVFHGMGMSLLLL